MVAPAHSSTTVLESAVDWLTVSVHRPMAAGRWAVRCNSLQRHEAAEGAKVAPWHVNHYSGQACGRCRFGYSGDKLLVMLSGEFAAEHFPWFWRDHETCTRIDVAVTIRTVEPRPDLAADYYVRAWQRGLELPQSPKATLIQSDHHGATLYLGKRSSSKFFRVYNKEAEQVDAGDEAGQARYRNAWRLELELHDVAAEAMGNWLNEPGDAGLKVRQYIARYLTEHELEVPYDWHQPATLPTGFRRRSDRDTRIDWLRRTVRPTIDWLRSSCTPDELRGILGLSDE